MIGVTEHEKQLRAFIGLSAVTYYVAGFVFAFAFAPTQIIQLVNFASRKIAPGFPEMPMPSGQFWLGLAFSMAMTIGALSFVAWYNVRRYKGYVVPLPVSKAASSLSSLFFVLSAVYFAYLVIFVGDGALFCATLVFLVQGNNPFFSAQTASLRRKPSPLKRTGPTKVVALKGEDKCALLDDVLAEAGFFEVLERRFRESGKSKDNFAVVIKPNFMFMHSKKDHSSYTDPELVEALIDRVVDRGFANVAVVEAQSTYGNYYKNREVLKVAEYIGYSTEKNYRIVDLTEEMVRYDYGGRLGNHFVGPTWRDADFRVSFAKNKTHTCCNYTLTLKNVYGTLPVQNKLEAYHAKRRYDWPTIETLKHFPVHFGLIDAVYSADGQFGVVTDPTPRHTKTIIGGENLIAIDWVGAKKMGLDPDDPKVGRYLPLAVKAFGRPTVDWVGDKSEYDPWVNVSQFFTASLDVVEELYAFSNFLFAGVTAMDEYFAFKWRGAPIILLRKILAPFKRIFFKYDYLGL